jgi:hypothetical protein
MVRRHNIMTRVGVRGDAKLLLKANKNSPMKLRGGPGRMGRILPARPRNMRIDPTRITVISSIIQGIPDEK